METQMQFSEQSIRDKMQVMRQELSCGDGMGISDDACSVSDQTLRKLAIDKLDQEADEQVTADIIRVTKEFEIPSHERLLSSISGEETAFYT